MSDDCMYDQREIEDRVRTVGGLVKLPDTISSGDLLSADAAFQLAAQLCIAAMEVDGCAG